MTINAAAFNPRPRTIGSSHPKRMAFRVVRSKAGCKSALHSAGNLRGLQNSRGEITCEKIVKHLDASL